MPARQDAHLDEFHRDQQWHKPVRVATTANVTISTALNAGDTIDGVTLAAGDRVLVKNQSTGSQNGIYVAGATPARAYDMVAGIQARGAFVYVIAGTANGGKLFYNTNTTLPTIDTDALTFTEFSGSGAPTGADYLVGTSQAGLSAEIVVGTTPGGELGGTWGSPTVDATHSGSAHADFIAKSVLTTQDDIIVRDGTGPARLAKGSDGQVLTVDPTTHHLVWATPTGGSGSVATDTIWDAKGDLAAGTGADTASKLTVGSDDMVLMADSAQSTGLKWAGSQTPSTQAFSDAAAEGTADTYARGDHKHGMPADPGASGGTVAFEGLYGNGMDGDATISVNTTINGDRYYHDLTVNNGISLRVECCRIFVSGTLTLTGTATIQHNNTAPGGNGGNGTAAAGGGAGAAGAAPTTGSTQSLPDGTVGRIGQVGGFNANGGNGSASTASTMGVSHSTSAAGGDSGTGRTGGTGAASPATTNSVDRPFNFPQIMYLRTVSSAAFGGSVFEGIAPSSGSGAGSAASGGGGSGGSGGSGGRVIVCARVITGSGNIQANGANGGNGGNGGGTNAGGGAGGSGGAGGIAVLLYKDASGWSGAVQAAGGSGGSGGTGIGSGLSGGTGTNGPTGKAISWKMG